LEGGAGRSRILRVPTYGKGELMRRKRAMLGVDEGELIITTVRLPAGMLERIEASARRMDQTRSGAMRRAVREYLAREEEAGK
jgi:hypothetical protein